MRENGEMTTGQINNVIINVTIYTVAHKELFGSRYLYSSKIFA